MSKRKKKWRKKINPEKSNKMIYAVAGGLAILFIAFAFIMLRGTGSSAPKGNREKFIGDTLKYIRRTDGFVDMKIVAQQNRVTLVYQEKERVDFVKIAQYAGMKLSNKLVDETVEIRLARDKEENLEHTFRFKNGRFISP